MLPFSLSEEAQSDIDDIWDYYERGEGAPVAERQYSRLRDVFQLIAANPHIGRSRAELRPGVRSFPVGNPPYVVFYTPFGSQIEITRVIHGSRDIQQLFE